MEEIVGVPIVPHKATAAGDPPPREGRGVVETPEEDDPRVAEFVLLVKWSE